MIISKSKVIGNIEVRLSGGVKRSKHMQCAYIRYETRWLHFVSHKNNNLKALLGNEKKK